MMASGTLTAAEIAWQVGCSASTGVNANLVFNWRKTARAMLSVAAPNGSAVACR